jgi:hypothetical protein
MPRATATSDVWSAIAEPRRRQIIELRSRGRGLAEQRALALSNIPERKTHKKGTS